MLHALILAGGGGTRFWPRSRQARPKQLLTLAGERSLLQATADRIEAQAGPERTWLITSAAHRDEARRQLPQLPDQQIIGEPCGRDTAAAVGLGVALIARTDPDAVIVVMPADHVIEPVQEFRRAVHAIEQLAVEHPDALITFGVPPTFPATGYGYIQRGEAIGTRQGVNIFSVQAFREKPDAATAERFVTSGDYFWNAGIFAWTARAIRSELQRQRPSLFAALERIADGWPTLSRADYEQLEKVSIDYAVMEGAQKVLVAQVPYRWDDVGSWLALERMHPQDADGNTVMGDHVGISTSNCVVVNDPGHLIATVGVSDLVIVQDGNCLLVAHRHDEGAIKQLVEKLKSQGREKFL